jgi:seryl-tRNA synthetase
MKPNSYKNKKTNKKQANKAKQHRKTQKGGSWWPFSGDSTATTQLTIYDKTIEKYKRQISELKSAEKVLEEKIAKIEIAKQSDQSISQENAKIQNLTEQKNKALKDTSDYSFSGFLSKLNFFSK